MQMGSAQRCRMRYLQMHSIQIKIIIENSLQYIIYEKC